MPLIKCKNVSLGYEGMTVLDDINLEINRGDYLCIVGENGSGKSTLIKGLLRLKAPLKGDIEYADDLPLNGIGYLPQQTQAQKSFPASVFEVVLSGGLNKSGLIPFYTKAQKKEAAEKLEILGISDLKNRCYQELSGGQQQRVLLARALMATKALLLLDEPAAGLDPVISSQMYKIIDEINKNRGITIIMVSHDIDVALKYATHILHVDNEDMFFGSVAEYRESEKCKRFLQE